MENWLTFINAHSEYAYFCIFGAALLAGMNIPISIDLLMIISATLAATIIPEHLYHLFFAVFLGCLFSAWVAYILGRTVGPRLLKLPFFSKLLSPTRMKKIKDFYKKKGPFALILGRFIPFGVRNALYMSCGISRVPFFKFVIWEGLACALWSSICFTAYYSLGKNIETLYSNVKMINVFIFIAFSVTVIGTLWYKKRKKVKEENV